MKQITINLVVWMGLASGLIGSISSAAGEGETFTGWPVMHVIKQEGSPQQTRVADLDQDGRDELILINTRQSRLEVYRWVPIEQREAAAPADPDRPNELPMAPQFKRLEIPTERLPLDVLWANLDDDRALELVILESPPLRVVIYKIDAQGDYHATHKWDLLQATPTGRDQVMLWNRSGGEGPGVMVSFNEGIQLLKLAANERPTWLEPRENKGRIDWWQVDLDGDGDVDLVEYSREKDQTVRWYELQDGQLLPAAALTDLQADAVQVLRGKAGVQVLLLGGLQEGVLKRFALGLSETKPLGRASPLPVSGAATAAWTGLTLGDRKALVLIDSQQPRAAVHWLTINGWQAGPTYPMIGDIKAIAAPAAKPGTLLLWTREGSDLHQTHWENGRLTYPRPMPQSEQVEDRAIVALDSIGPMTWWVQRVGEDLDLYIWLNNADEPQCTRFTGTGTKIERVQWLGGERLLVMDKFARSLKLVVREGDKTLISEPTHLKKAKIEEFVLIGSDHSPRPARMTDGVIQWLDEKLQPTDQVMLPDGLRMSDYLVLADGSALALDSSGKKIHQLKADESGVMRLTQSSDISGGVGLVQDPALGLIVVDREQLLSLRDGAQRKLEMIDSIDSRVGRPSGVREATIHRMFVTDVTGDGRDEIVLADDRRHQLTVLRPTENELTPLLSWPVYEDTSYPYGGEMGENLAGEPRQVQGLDFENDGKPDLILLCHDRLLIYLGAKEAE